eukprot:TRINITY_DN2023_c0_g1_i1.p1 TRINITY_DN2023_c0_g1~~TRINITY_DN2023_c0_g1_i1.p1  ORF type:complete len:404 (-),score=51.64 TRINITY_DN2023_c0_g1_i1:1174-2385(-)
MSSQGPVPDRPRVRLTLRLLAATGIATLCYLWSTRVFQVAEIEIPETRTARPLAVIVRTESCDTPEWHKFDWVTQGVPFSFSIDRAALKEVAQPVANKHAGQVAIITFSNLRYGDVLVNWLIGLNRLNMTQHVLIFALNSETKQWLVDHNVAAFLLDMPDFRALWFVRAIVFLQLAQAGINFIHSDTDAMWIRDPIPRFFMPNTSFSLKFSQGTIAPVEVYSAWHFVVCAGMFYAKAAPLTVRLMAAFVDHITHNPRVPKHATDQDSVNLVLRDQGVQWKAKNSTYTKQLFGKGFACFEQEIVGSFAGTEERVALLPHHLFIRLAMVKKLNDELPYVTHYYSKTNQQSKRSTFASHGIWFLRDDWASAPFEGSLSSWLSRCALGNVSLHLTRGKPKGKHWDAS